MMKRTLAIFLLLILVNPLPAEDRVRFSRDVLPMLSEGRDHHPRCFPMWLARGCVKPGLTYGSTDDFSYNTAENPVHVRDLHATVLHLLGIDHERLTHRFQGLDFKLTGVEPARAVTDLFA